MQAIRRDHKKSGGFTLMELLIVIAVLGLLLGMLIPRLGGVTDDTVDTVCDTNNKGVRYFTQLYYNKNAQLPNGLTNLVDVTNTAPTLGVAGLPTYQDDTVAGAEALATEFTDRNWPGQYFPNQDEMEELAELGITTVYDLVGTGGGEMLRKTLANGDAVMAMGVQSADNATAPTFTFTGSDEVGNPHFVGRFMMAVNDRSDLVKSGMIQASALCPGAVLGQDSFSFAHYVLVLPRLEATVARFIDGVAALADTTPQDGVVDDEIVFTAAGGTGTFIFDFESMAGWNFDMSCPEGHKWPDFDEDAWVHTSGLGL
jgi:prepilin-type N-terminal cleavage/methylation domain-containing protein